MFATTVPMVKLSVDAECETGWEDTAYCEEYSECAYCTDPICYYGGCSYLKGREVVESL